MRCAYCDAMTSADARFCSRCGHALQVEDVTVAPSDVGLAGADAATHAVTRPPSKSHRPLSSNGWLTSSDSISHGRFAPGVVLDNRYRIIGLVGRGGMGEVYRADDLRLGQPVALKFLPDDVATDPKRLAQFHNEVRTARQVSHPNICRVHDISEVDGHLFLSMELVDGEDLASSLRRIGRFPEDKATEIARQLCAGLAAAHERGVLHRDLKPANVMLDGNGNVRLMDFGLAAVGGAESIRAGTPAYMAPEQLLGREVTARSDIYALGLVLYELFTGRRAFIAATLNELIEEHQSGELTPPREVVSAIDPAIERAILRCLDPNPARRPTSALAVAAALPGGDPLAAALAAGETPSPQMVAATGEGTGLDRRVALFVFVAVLAGIAGAYAIALRNSPLQYMRPELNAAVLAQRARDAVRQLGYAERAQDEAYGFDWDDELFEHIRTNDNPRPQWTDVVSQRPSPLVFWYRRSQSAMMGWQFHDDLLTPGIVSPDDPPPIESGMMQLMLDHRGLLTAFEAIPPQVEESQTPVAPLDWGSLLTLAALDPRTLQMIDPQWNWLAAADTRAAWTGTWPASTRPLRVEAAARRGQPVAFAAIAPWTQPWRTPEGSTGGETAFVIIIFLLALSVAVGGGLLARYNLRHGRGDRAGAFALGSIVSAALWAIWVCKVHVSVSTAMLGVFLFAIATTVFYGVLFWTIYLALEPFVRRYWPQTLVSWTTVLGGRVRDAIVGRDVLFGVALGVAIALLVIGTELLSGNPIRPSPELLNGLRSTIGEVLSAGIYAVRTALFVFYLLFLFRMLLRNQWAAAFVFVLIFSVMNALTSERPLFDAASTFLYFSLFAFAVLRWGLMSLTVGLLVANLLLIMPATTDVSAWYVSATLLLIAIPAALATWAFYRSVGGQLWQGELLP